MQGTAELIGTAWDTWLMSRVQRDIGRPAGPDLGAAVDSVAKRLLVEDLSNGLGQRATSAEPGPSAA
ncbi:hypothetical protein [Streptomyces roseochromogenus]|uniref:Uncharacterized protein n=1 Tax=Streptomyces roseochromogenus subsp. oscitans DS 12.976 TaxID=1352936 RepID=V6L260_STRRC|nr:hypothetical protein M878_06290 [Streptomyces roseochromogenus subsp. oscitans DS 12.976]